MAGAVPVDVTDLKIFVKTGATYGAAIDVPVVQEIEFNTEASSDMQWGDGQITALITTDRSASGSATVGAVNPAAFAAMNGSSVVSNGTGNTAGVHYIQSSRLLIPYIQIQALIQTGSDDGGVTHLVVPLSKVSSGPNMTFNRDIPTFGFDFDAMSFNDSFGWVSQWADPTKALSTMALVALPTAA